MMGEAKKLISEAKNICLIPSENEPESLTAALALFYTLKELDKNVNLIIDNLPENFNFFLPSLDFISYPKNFVVSIPRKLTEVSQIYYEKNEDGLKIHLTVDRGYLKKDNISFYASAAKPDLVITLGIQDLQSQLSNQLDSFGFILDALILNIDNRGQNKKFGSVNLVQNSSLSEIAINLLESVDKNLIRKNTANCLLAGLVIYYENFKSPRVASQTFQTVSELIEAGAEHQQILNNIYHKITEGEVNLLGRILQSLKSGEGSNVSLAVLDYNEFEDFNETQANFVIEKIKAIGLQKDLMVLWQSRASDPVVKVFFYSKKEGLISKISQLHQGTAKKDWVFLSMPSSDINFVKDELLKLILS